MIILVSNICYKGDVNVKIDSNRFLYSNNGLPNLFKLICEALAGNNVSKNIPEKIDLRYSFNDSQDTWESCLINNQFLTQTNYLLENGSWKLKVAASIPYSELSVTPLESLSGAIFRIYLMSSKEDLAFIDINRSDILMLNPGSQALIEWTLTFSNI